MNVNEDYKMNHSTYLQFHLLFTIPVILALLGGFRNIFTRVDANKIRFLSCMAVVYSLVWECWTLQFGTWDYRENGVLFKIFKTPIEEVAFFVIQTIIVVLIHSIMSKLQQPACFGIKQINSSFKSSFAAFGCVLLASCLYFACVGPNRYFYLTATGVFGLPVALYLLLLCGQEWLRVFWLLNLVSIILPTLYFCLIDVVGIKWKIWSISLEYTTGLNFFNVLPIEEALFFFTSSTLIVLGCNLYDYVLFSCYCYDPVLVYKQSWIEVMLIKCLLNRWNTHKSTIEFGKNSSYCCEILKKSSQSFYLSSFIFDRITQNNLIVVYAWCRLLDDSTDGQQDHQSKLSLVKKQRQIVLKYFWTKSELQTNYGKLKFDFQNETDPCLRALIKALAPIVPGEPFLELLDGQAWDLKIEEQAFAKFMFETTNDLLQYCDYVAASVGEICIYCCWRNSKQLPPLDVINNARNAGRILQLINIARDIVTDYTNNRFYVPKDFESNLQPLLDACKSFPSTEANIYLSSLALKHIKLAEEFLIGVDASISKMPRECRPGLRAAIRNYQEIGAKIKFQTLYLQKYETRTRILIWKRIMILLTCATGYSPYFILFSVGFLLRLALLIFSEIHDKNSVLKYTDVDYRVFTDAATFLYNGQSPFQRETYRYTPLIALLLVPNVWFNNFGKVLFAFSDLAAGWYIVKLLEAYNNIGEFEICLLAALWVWNPMVSIISTRGNMESILSALTLMITYMFEKEKVVLPSIVYGLLVHIKIFPIIYTPAILLKMRTFNRAFKFAFISSATFFALGYIMYNRFGMDYIENAWLYHLQRIDHRHNFSIYQMLLYYHSFQDKKIVSMLAFVPQFIATMAIIFAGDIHTQFPCIMMLQSQNFVSFNKVYTSQYFMWYLHFVPIAIIEFWSHKKSFIFAIISWIMAQAFWLSSAYNMEFLGIACFNKLFVASCALFISNIAITILGLRALCK